MPELIKRGHVYIAVPPLFKITTNNGKTKEYCSNEEEKQIMTAKLDKQGKQYHVQRYKGLGEMNYQELEMTAMNPDSRVLYQLTMKSVKKTKDVITMLMADGKVNVSNRRNFINKRRHILDINNID